MNILLVALSGIGNLLMQTPVIAALRRANPASRISVLVAPRGTASVIERNPDVAQILVGAAKPSARAWLGMVRTLQQRQFHAGIVLYPGQRITSSSVLFFGRARRRVGHHYTYGPLRTTGLFLTDALPLRSVHDVEQNLDLLTPFGISVDTATATYVFPLDETDLGMASAFVTDHHLDGTPLIGIHPGAHADMMYKRWPVDRWSTLIERLANTYGATILVFGGPDEQTVQSRVCGAAGRARCIPVQLPLRASAALMRRCRFFASNDSGLMHVAVSQGVPTFGLFGPTDERRTAPWGPLGHVIRAPGTRPEYDVTRLADVRRERAPHPSLLALTVDHVSQTITERITKD